MKHRCSWCAVRMRWWQRWALLCRKCREAERAAAGQAWWTPPCESGSRRDAKPDRMFTT